MTREVPDGIMPAMDANRQQDDGGGHRGLWAWVTVAALVVATVSGMVSYGMVFRHPLLLPGRPLPPVQVLEQTEPGPVEHLLVTRVEGITEMLVMTPTCDVCTADLVERITRAEADPAGGEGHPLAGLLLLVIRSDGIPRAAFMDAYRRGQELGMRTLSILPERARAMGIARVPAEIQLSPDGVVEHIVYRPGEDVRR